MQASLSQAEIILRSVELSIDLVGRVAWPLTVLAILLIFKLQFRELFGRIVSGELPGGTKIQFRETSLTARQVEISAASASSSAENEGVTRELLIKADQEIVSIAEQAAAAADESQVAEFSGALKEALVERQVLESKSLELAKQSKRRRENLLYQLGNLETELARSAERLEKIEVAPQLLQKYTAEIADLRGEFESVTADLNIKKTKWLRDRQDVTIKLQLMEGRHAELLAEIAQLRERGPEAQCPICTKPLGDEFRRRIREVGEHGAEAFKDIKFWRDRMDALSAVPADVREAERKVSVLEGLIEDRAKKLVRVEYAIQDLERLKRERVHQGQEAEGLRESLAAMGDGE